MKTKYIYKGEEILHSTFISLCRKIGVNGGRKFTTLEKLQQKAKQFCRESKTGAKGICGVDRNGNNVTFTPIESTKRGISFGKFYKINVNNTL